MHRGLLVLVLLFFVSLCLSVCLSPALLRGMDGYVLDLTVSTRSVLSYSSGALRRWHVISSSTIAFDPLFSLSLSLY